MTKIKAESMKNIITAMSSGYTVEDIARNYGVKPETIRRRIRSYINNTPIIKPSTPVATKTSVTATANIVKEDSAMTKSVVSTSAPIVRTRLTPAGTSVNITGTLGSDKYATIADGHVFTSLFVNIKDRNGNETTTIYKLKLWGDAAKYYIEKGLKQGDLVRFSGYMTQSNATKYVEFNVNYVNDGYGYGFKAECQRAVNARSENKVAC